MRDRITLLSLAALLNAAVSLAQASAGRQTISGVVQDTSGAAITDDADLVLDRPDGAEVAHTVSDGNGRFFFRDSLSGSYTIDAKQQGFEETRRLSS